MSKDTSWAGFVPKWFSLRLEIFNLVGCPLVSSGAWDDYRQYVLERGSPGEAAHKEQKTHFVEVAFATGFSSQTRMGR
jgi:hypothetical protein